jgi:HlyD family secretion protein
MPDVSAMDRVIVRRRPWRRIAIAAALLAVSVAAVAYALRPQGGKSRAVDGQHVTTGAVTRGEFEDIIEVRARVTPLRTTYVDTPSGGQVEAILVEDGATVTKGQPLISLSNTQLQLDLISREAQITEQLNNLRTLELAQAQSNLANERELVDVRYQIKRLSRQVGVTKTMVADDVAAPNELADQSEELAYYQDRLRVQTKMRGESDRLQRQQLAQMRAASAQLEKNLDIARKNLDGLEVKAPADGKLSAFTLEIGQSLSPGDRIAQIDDPDHYKVIADIDEFYLSRVDLGQHADYPLDGTTYQLQVAKIRPQVQNGVFQVELTFVGDMPPSVRRGQTAQIRLQLGQPSQALIVPNAAFYNDTGGAWVFVVSTDHTRAVRRAVHLGRRNPQQIEVLDGLSEGEEIVTSPYTNYLDLDRLDLN